MKNYKHFVDVLESPSLQDGVFKRIVEIEDNLAYLKQVLAQAVDEIERLRTEVKKNNRSQSN
jgi:hypothetical protein